jgi:predicted XRE-type DNA-binding protein
VPGSLWDERPVQEALVRRDIGRFLERYLQQTGASQSDIATCIGRSQPEVWRIMRTERQVLTIDLLTDIADGLAMPDRARLLMGLAPAEACVGVNSDGPAAGRTARRRREAAVGAVPAGTQPATESTGARWSGSLVDTVRTVVDLLDSAGADHGLADDGTAGAESATLQWLLAPPQTVAPQTNGGRRVGPHDVARLGVMQQSLKSFDDAHGGGVALPMAVAYFRREAAPLLCGRYSTSVGQTLFDATAQLLLSIAWMAYDADQQGLARRGMVQALRLSHAADNRLLGGRVLAAMSHQALYLGNMAEGVDLARAARMGTGRVATPKATSMFAAMEACAHAAVGDMKLSTDALVAAEGALDRAATDDDPTRDAWLDFDEGGLWGHAARAYRDLGHRAAGQYAERSLAQCHLDHSRTRAQRNAILATVHVQRREIEQACAVGGEVVAAAWQLDSTRVNHDVAELARLIQPVRQRAAHEFADRARSLLAAKSGDARHQDREPSGS